MIHLHASPTGSAILIALAAVAASTASPVRAADSAAKTPPSSTKTAVRQGKTSPARTTMFTGKSVRAFGSVGDGRTDDNRAIRAAPGVAAKAWSEQLPGGAYFIAIPVVHLPHVGLSARRAPRHRSPQIAERRPEPAVRLMSPRLWAELIEAGQPAVTRRLLVQHDRPPKVP